VAVDREQREIAVGDRVVVDGAGFTNRHRGTVLASDDVNVKVQIDGLLGNPFYFTAAFDGVIEDLTVVDAGDEEGRRV